MASSLTREEILKAIVYRVEKTVELMREESRKQNKRVSQVVQVLDMDGFGRKHMWIPGDHRAKARVMETNIHVPLRDVTELVVYILEGTTTDEVVAIPCRYFGTVHTCMFIIDAGAELISDMLSTIDGNYPEMLFKTYIINGKCASRGAFYLNYTKAIAATLKFEIAHAV